MSDSNERSVRPSKTQRKREMAELQVLGEKLLLLKAKQLKNLMLSEELMQAVALGQRLTKKEAVRRHAQYIGKLMRDLDDETIVRIKQYLEVLNR